ncbi:MAG: SDR family NAD(P)-dependent oxidoreductase [Acidobacteriota bacterium]
MKKAIVVGASSGIGRELAKILAKNGYHVGLVARRANLLNELAHEFPNQMFTKAIDVSKPVELMPLLRELIAEMNGVDLFVVSAGNGFINPELAWKPEQETIDVNVSGFTAVVNVAVEHLQARGCGHIVGISSLAALRGNRVAPAYNASKAFVSNYLEGLQHKFSKLKLPIIVTDVQPGFVDTAMAKGEGMFWVASPEKAARQIFDAIRKQKKQVYITKRWRIIAWVIKILPDWLYHKL